MNLQNCMQDFIDFRIEEIGKTLIKENPRYQELNKEVQKAYKEILELLPPNKRGLLLEMDIKYCAICAENEKIMYKQGMKDGKEMNTV